MKPYIDPSMEFVFVQNEDVLTESPVLGLGSGAGANEDVNPDDFVAM